MALVATAAVLARRDPVDRIIKFLAGTIKRPRR
jgi:hypothetical protein